MHGLAVLSACGLGGDYQLATQKVAINPIAPHIPEASYAMFQMTFA